MRPAINVLPSSPKISDLTKVRCLFYNSMCAGLVKKLDKSAALQIRAVFVTRECLDSRNVF